ncbi:hypothetical protein, partial [Pseudomonas sp. Kh7]|uniref:hypothetical protein n=1 Tax=Pseudomonas sp. Kh7 TaxID=2093743 RepID=UPI001C499FFE
HRFRPNAGLVETSVCQMSAFCEHFMRGRTLHLPEYKALPIMGPLIALGIGYFSFALAYLAGAVNIARRGSWRFCN